MIIMEEMKNRLRMYGTTKYHEGYRNTGNKSNGEAERQQPTKMVFRGPTNSISPD